MRESWTDRRLDDFAAHTDRRFDAVDAEIRDLRSDMNARFEKIDARFEALHRLMFQSSVLVIVALIGLIATQL